MLWVTAGGTVVWAQTPVPAVAASTSPQIDGGSVRLLVGRSTVLDVGTAITRVSLTSADVADALVTSPTQVLIHGKTPGTISMFVWDRSGVLRRFDVAVQRDIVRLSEQMQEMFPNEKIQVESSGRNIVLNGVVSTKDVIERAVNLAAGYVEKKEEVTTLLQLPAGGPSNQVLLRVRFAEVSRSALTELGVAFAANGFQDGRWYGRSTTQQFPAPEWDDQGRFVFSDFLNLFLFDAKNELATVVRALQTKGLFQSLAEPNLIAESGKEASFLAGGEIPIPIAQGTGGNVAISVTFKEFGVRLSFTPTVNGNRVNLRVRPEVSTLDFANAVVLQGFRIPALSTRRTETELELLDGQTFAIAGLINNTVRSTLSKIPGIGDVPILGLLFQSKAAQKEQTELVVMITPQILPTNSPGVTPNLPRVPENYLDPVPDNRLKQQPPPAFGNAAPAASPAATAVRVETPATPQSSAAAAVAALTPSAPRPIELSQPAQAPAATPAPTASTPATVLEDPGTAPATAVASGTEAPADLAPAVQPSAPQTDSAPDAAPRRLTREERAVIEAIRREEQQRAKQAAEQAKREAEAQKRAQAEARRQAEREAELQRAAERRAQEEARKQQEEAREQAEREREQQKAVDDAAAKLRQAEEAYYAELSKQQGNQ
jgi:pilus assembly protein CpaC